MKKVILYINQFFGNIGGEDKADFEPFMKDGPAGPGVQLQKALKGAEITHTIICGDNYMNSNREKALKKICGFLQDKEFDLFAAGPAFQAGRYGMSCGEVCKFVRYTYDVPAVTCMYEENPGVDAYRMEDIYILRGGKNAGKMRKDIEHLALFLNKLMQGEEILWADAEGYFGHGIRKEVYVERTAADRAVDMLLAKLAGEHYETEFKIEMYDKVNPAPAIENIEDAKIAIVSTGGLVPAGNPDRMPSATASIWKAYDITDTKQFNRGEYYSIHGGYSTNSVNDDPEVLLPLGTLRELVHEKRIGELDTYFYSTTGNITTLKDSKRMGKEIAAMLHERYVTGVIFVST